MFKGARELSAVLGNEHNDDLTDVNNDEINTAEVEPIPLINNNINNEKNNDSNSEEVVEDGLGYDVSMLVEDVVSGSRSICFSPVQLALDNEVPDELSVATPILEEHVESNLEGHESKFSINDSNDHSNSDNGQGDVAMLVENVVAGSRSICVSSVPSPLDNEVPDELTVATPLEKSSAGNRAYIPIVQDPDKFLVAGRQDGASSHYIPIFQHSQIELPQNAVQDEIVPFALRLPNDEICMVSGDSKAAFKQAVSSVVTQDHRLSMQDVVIRHNRKQNEVIVLDSDEEGDFDQTAKEFVLDTDVSSENPQPVKVHHSLTKILKKHQTEGISFLYKCLIGNLADVTKKDHTGGNYNYVNTI
uniref:Uncharacterized protein n=1 Tax=Panagrolaimus superbus TaxID=310955 RepID=A0A914Z563_9BILA